MQKAIDAIPVCIIRMFTLTGDEQRGCASWGHGQHRQPLGQGKRKDVDAGTIGAGPGSWEGSCKFANAYPWGGAGLAGLGSALLYTVFLVRAVLSYLNRTGHTLRTRFANWGGTHASQPVALRALIV